MWYTPSSLKTWQSTCRYISSKAEWIFASVRFTSRVIFLSDLNIDTNKSVNNILWGSLTHTHTVSGLSIQQMNTVTVFDNSNKSYSFICFTSCWCNLEKHKFKGCWCHAGLFHSLSCFFSLITFSFFKDEEFTSVTSAWKRLGEAAQTRPSTPETHGRELWLFGGKQGNNVQVSVHVSHVRTATKQPL